MLIESIDTLIFDLDNTLIDRNAAMRQTIKDWLTAQGYTGKHLQTALADCMQRDNFGYADRLEFSAWMLSTYGRTKDTTAKQVQQLLHINNSRNVQPDPQVQMLLQDLRNHFLLVLATNGGSRTQRAKLQHSQLESFFQPEAIYVSGEMEFEKPDPNYFKKIIDDLHLDVTTTLVIGDNLLNDIKAANECGLYTCWVSHDREKENGTEPTMTIRNITEISAWSSQLT
jgi:HAD superfamily hydrolase (TIGR01549 family)